MYQRFLIITERQGLVAQRDTQEDAEDTAFYVAVSTGRTVYVHDRLTEV